MTFWGRSPRAWLSANARARAFKASGTARIRFGSRVSNPMETQREDTTGETQREIFVFMFSKYQAPFRKGKLRTDQLFSRCPPALAKAPVFQPPTCLVKSRPSSQTPSSPSHSHRMIQNRLKLTKPYTSVPLPLGQSVMFP